MRTRLFALLCAVAAIATLNAQGERSPQEPAQPVFRSAADLIRVDMYATRDGKFVTDLKADEIEILEDGVKQDIETFEFVNIAADAPGDADERDEGDPATRDPRARVFVVFVDTHTTRLEGERNLRLSLVRFLDQLLGPSDLVGLMTPDMTASQVRLGRRATVISDVANDERWLKRVTSARADLVEHAWENCYGSPRGPSQRLNEMKARYRAKNTIAAMEDLVGHLRDLREERKAVLLLTGGWPFLDEGALLSNAPRTETDACAQDRVALARTDYGDLLDALTRSANRANVSFYPVNTRQLSEPPQTMLAQLRSQIRQRERRAMDTVSSQLRNLAEDTDGLAEVKTRNFEGITRRIIDDTSSYYLIGYQSTNSKIDGRFRNITVRTTRPGVRIRARRGYGGESARTLLVATEPAGPVVDPRMTTALTFVERFDGGAPFWGRSSAWEPGKDAESGGGAFWFVGELAAQTRTQLSWSAGATADVVVIAADKTQVMSSTVALGPSETAFTLRVPAEGSLAPGDYSVRVRLRPKADEDLQLSDSARVTLDAGTGSLGEALIWRRGPSTRLDYARTADPRFRRNERLRLEFPTSSADAADARVLDRMGRPISLPAGLSERQDSSGGFRWLVIEPPIAALAPGDYAIEVSQGGSSRITAFRVIP
jgi:VWFA-related protein